MTSTRIRIHIMAHLSIEAAFNACVAANNAKKFVYDVNLPDVSTPSDPERIPMTCAHDSEALCEHISENTCVMMTISKIEAIEDFQKNGFPMKHTSDRGYGWLANALCHMSDKACSLMMSPCTYHFKANVRVVPWNQFKTFRSVVVCFTWLAMPISSKTK